MRYIQYFVKSTTSNKLVKACDNRGIVTLNGRFRISRAIEEAFECNGKRRPFYSAFQIFEGENLLKSKPVTPIIKLEEK